MSLRACMAMRSDWHTKSFVRKPAKSEGQKPVLPRDLAKAEALQPVLIAFATGFMAGDSPDLEWITPPLTIHGYVQERAHPQVVVVY
jgi:hypothetical protein